MIKINGWWITGYISISITLDEWIECAINEEICANNNNEWNVDN